MNDDPTVEITAADLEIIRAALNSALHQNTVLDLAEQYRKLSNRDQMSPMSKALTRAHELAEAYLGELEDAQDETNEPS